MNDSKRTPEKEKTLKQKSFHKRLLRIIKPIFKINLKSRKEFSGSGSGGGGEKTSSFRYSLEALKSTTEHIYSYKYMTVHSKKRISKSFRKSQLLEKVILINGEQFRIKSKY